MKLVKKRTRRLPPMKPFTQTGHPVWWKLPDGREVPGFSGTRLTLAICGEVMELPRDAIGMRNREDLVNA